MPELHDIDKRLTVAETNICQIDKHQSYLEEQQNKSSDAIQDMTVTLKAYIAKADETNIHMIDIIEKLEKRMDDMDKGKISTLVFVISVVLLPTLGFLIGKFIIK